MFKKNLIKINLCVLIYSKIYIQLILKQYFKKNCLQKIKIIVGGSVYAEYKPYDDKK